MDRETTGGEIAGDDKQEGAKSADKGGRTD
jgi:hypothetical protein